jgi:GT2 family glycosyltransferase
MPSENILILLVNYFNESETCAFVRDQLHRQTWKDIEIVITDNGSREPESLAKLSVELPRVGIVTAGENLGYLPGAALGLKKYLDRAGELPGFMMLSNTDMEFADERFLEKLVSPDKQSGYDILGPDIYSDLLHHHQNPYMPARISLKKLKMLTFLTSNAILYFLLLTWYYVKSRVMSKLPWKTSGNQVAGPVYGIHGSCMIFCKSFFNKGGNLEYPNHLFGEEIYLAEMAMAKGMTVGYDPALKMLHHEHSSTGMYKSSKLVKQMHQSYRYLLDQRKNS